MGAFDKDWDADAWFPDIFEDVKTALGHGSSYPIVADEDEARQLTDGGAPVRVWIEDHHGDGGHIAAKAYPSGLVRYDRVTE